jgi:hypothetical protein
MTHTFDKILNLSHGCSHASMYQGSSNNYLIFIFLSVFFKLTMKFILTNLIFYLTQPTYKIDTWVDSHPHIDNMHSKIVSRYIDYTFHLILMNHN